MTYQIPPMAIRQIVDDIAEKRGVSLYRKES
jgi:hypothetical protein